MSAKNLSYQFYRTDTFGIGIENDVYDLLAELLTIDDCDHFSLKTIYPGLVIGSGYAHGNKESDKPKKDEAYQLGFYFDYTTGLPVIPGSSVKGALRSFFPSFGETQESLKKKTDKEALHEYINFHLGEGNALDQEQMKAFEAGIFKNGDVFYDAIVTKVNTKLLAPDYITPHKNMEGKTYRDANGQKIRIPDEFVDPTPIKFLKVAPGVTFTFQFKLNDFIDGTLTITAYQKLSLFKNILLDIGIGAKTNVGYGKFIES